MPPALTLAPRRLGAVNWIGLRTLYLKEVRRFAKVFTQTLVSPLVTTLLFLAIFTLALGRSVQQVGGVGYAEFLFPGLVMMSMVQNAFANTSSSLVIAKIQGNIVDVRTSTQDGNRGNSNVVSRKPGLGQPCNLPPTLLPPASMTITNCTEMPTAP